MLKTYTEEEVETRLRKLPEALQDAMYSADVAQKMGEIGKKFGLTREKTGYLSEETGYVVLGLTRPQEFVGALVEALEMDTDKAKSIAKEVNHQIFHPLREALRKTHETDITEEEIEKGTATVRPSAPLVRPRPEPSLTRPAPAPTVQTPAPPPIPPPARPPVTPQQVGPVRPPMPARPPEPARPPAPLTPAPPRPSEGATPAPPPAPRRPSPALEEFEEEEENPMHFPQKIVLEKKPDPSTPQPKIPPIDLRARTDANSTPTPPRHEQMRTAIQNSSTPATKKVRYEEEDPYLESAK